MAGILDQFDISVQQNESISDIDRFNYLKKHLSGPALRTVSGLTLSSANYKEAVTILTERYGNHQVLISAHMDSLLKMKKVKKIENMNGLRRLYTDVEDCVGNLLKHPFMAVFSVPILKKKLPDELLIIISRKFAGNVWLLDELLKYFLRSSKQKKVACLMLRSHQIFSSMLKSFLSQKIKIQKVRKTSMVLLTTFFILK